jgi:methylmalonyl-CoA/ethylmalonyl-CoA epimerase
MMKVTRIEHIGLAVRDIDAAKQAFEKVLGFTMEYEETLEKDSTRLAMYPVGETLLELLQGTSDRAMTSEWIAERGEGIWHLCLEVDDIHGALAELKEKDVKLIDEEPRPGHGGCLVAFIDPSSTSNIVIELTQLPGEPARH